MKQCFIKLIPIKHCFCSFDFKLTCTYILFQTCKLVLLSSLSSCPSAHAISFVCK